MKIECPQCEQGYEFDDQLVPVSGYMAHCSRCAHVFFLARGGIKSLDALEQESLDQSEPQVNAPEPGGLGENEASPGEAAAPESIESESETREFSGVAVDGADDFDMSGAAFGAPDHENDDGTEVSEPSFGDDDAPTQAADFDEMLALSGTLGEPLAVDSDPYKSRSSVSIGGLLVKGVLGLALFGAAALAGLFFLLPDLYNEHLAEVTGIRAGTHPRVIELQSELPKLWVSDTKADRDQALALLKEGLELEPNDAELLGLGGMYYTIESIRHEMQAQLVRDEGDFASERIRKLSKLSIDERSDDTLEEIKALKQRVFESSSQGTKFDNQASRNTLLSSRHTGPALESDAELWTALLARSLEATSNDKSVDNADRYLKRVAKIFEVSDLSDSASINQPWLAIALGYRNIYNPDTLDVAERYFSRAAELEPTFVAAQMGLVEVAYRQANWSLAAERLDGVLSASANHELAKYWRGLLDLPLLPVVKASQPSKVDGKDKSSSQVKKKKKRKKSRKKKRKKRSKKRKPKTL